MINLGSPKDYILICICRAVSPGAARFDDNQEVG